MRILIVNAHSCCNLGDAAILLTMIDSLSKQFPSAQFTVVSDTPEKDFLFYNDIKIVGIKYPWETKKGLSRRLSKAVFSIKFWLHILLMSKINKYSGFSFLQKDAAEVIKLIHNSEMIISCGGGYINSLGKLFARLSLLMCAVYYKKPVVMYSQSVSDLSNKFDKFLVRKTLNSVDLFIARELITFNYLKQLGVHEKRITLHADSAFLLPQTDLTFLKEISLSSLCCSDAVGLTVTRWAFPGANNPEILIDNYQKCIREFASYITNQLGLKLIVFPQVTGPSKYSDDRLFAEEIFGTLENKNITLLKHEYEPVQLKSMIAQVSVFVGTRMHSNIFALGANVPTLAIAYQDKTKGIMDMLDLGEWVIPIETISKDELISMFLDLWDSRVFLVNKLIDKLPEIQKSAIEPSIICKKIYDIKTQI